MAEIIDLTVSPQPEVIEISSDRENTPRGSHSRTQENKKRKEKKRRRPNGATSDGGIGSSAHPSRAHSPDIGNKHAGSGVKDPSIPPSTIDGLDLFIFDDTAAPLAGEVMLSSAEPAESDGDSNKLLLPSHVVVFHDDGSIPCEVIPPSKLSSDDEEYIEYLEYEDRKAPGLVRYFEVEGEEASQSRPSIFKCKNCGAEGDHKTYECPIQICLTCGARDEHSTRSCPIGKTCYTCGMKGHINKTCPNRFSTPMVASDIPGACNRCGFTEHRMNECPTIWRIYQYVNDEERIAIMKSREEKKQLAIGEGGEGYIGGEVWCYNCANTGHLGDDCDELPHPTAFPSEKSAFSSRNVMSSPFFDPAAEPVFIKHGPRERENLANWEDPSLGAPIDVGKRGKNKDKERLEKRFREQEDTSENWFDDIRNVKKRNMPVDRRATPPRLHDKRLKFGTFRDGGHKSPPPPSSPTKSSEPSLLARLSDAHEGGDHYRQSDHANRSRHETLQPFRSPIRIRGAAADHRNQDKRGQDFGWDRHGPRYRGGYDR